MINSKIIIVVITLSVALGISITMNLLNEIQPSSLNQFEPELIMIEPKIIKNSNGTYMLETGLELTTGKYPLEYENTIKINGEHSAGWSDTLEPNLTISRNVLKPLESGEYVVQHEYNANGKDNYGNPISFVKTQYFNITVP